MKSLLTAATAALLIPLGSAQDQDVLTLDFGGNFQVSTNHNLGAGRGGGPGAGMGGGSSSTASIDIDGFVDQVSFDAPSTSLLGTVDGAGDFTPFDHDATAQLESFDLNGDEWLDATELDAAGVALCGGSGAVSASSLISDLYAGLVEVAGESGYGGVARDGSLFGVSPNTAEVSPVGYAIHTSTTTIDPGPPPPPPVPCAVTVVNWYTEVCTTAGAACSERTATGKIVAGTCDDYTVRGVSVCGCTPLAPLLSTTWLLALSVSLLGFASVIALRTSKIVTQEA